MILKILTGLTELTCKTKHILELKILLILLIMSKILFQKNANR